MNFGNEQRKDLFMACCVLEVFAVIYSYCPKISNLFLCNSFANFKVFLKTKNKTNFTLTVGIVLKKYSRYIFFI